jgi:hypothetical protein
MTRSEQDLTRTLYNKSYRYNDSVSSTLRLYALHWCDTAAQGKYRTFTIHTLAVLTAHRSHSGAHTRSRSTPHSEQHTARIRERE